MHPEPNPHLAALDAYLDALRRMDNPTGAAVRALDHAEAAGLPPLEQHLAASLVHEAAGGTRERDWLIARLHLADKPALPGVAHADASNRLYQAVANLRGAGLWPWYERPRADPPG